MAARSPRDGGEKLRSTSTQPGETGGGRRTQSLRQRTALNHKYTVVASEVVERRLYRGVPGRDKEDTYGLTSVLARYKLVTDNREDETDEE